MLRRFLGLVLAGGLWLGMATAADAQFSLTIGNPYTGGVAIGTPFVGAYGGGLYGVPYVGYGALPGTTIYSSGYSGIYPGYYPGVRTFAYPYGYSSYYGYAPAYRYRTFGGFRRGFVGGFW